MRCLYCGKQLPLLKKLTGGGEFCSEAHRQKYQEEYNKLALSRLLQTQNADSDAPRRGELVLASRQHPALQSGRPPLRALEAPKSADSPLTGNWTPGANRTQRALPPPTPLPQTNLPLGIGGALGIGGGKAGALDAAPSVPPSNFPQPITRQPLFPPQAKQEAKPETLFRYEQRPDASQPRLDQSLPRLDQGRAGELPVKSDSVRPEPIANRFNNKRDAFSFRPMEPFPEQKTKSAALPPAPVAEQVSLEQTVEKAPRALPAPTPIPPVAKASPPGRAKDPEPSTPPEGPFIIEEVRRPQPPPVPKLEMLGMEAFTKGHPPKPDGWAPWIAEVQSPPGELEQPDQLFQLTGPPGMASPGETGSIVSEQQESEQERQEIRKKILENQVKPGDFKQMVPTAPTGPNTVLPICPPAPALEHVPVVTKAKAPAPDPSLHTAPASTGEELWTGWSLTGAARIRESLGLIAPEPAKTPDLVPAADAPARPFAAEPARATLSSALSKPSNMPVVAKPSTVEAPRNYRAAEALKSAAQNVTIVESAPKVEVRQPDKPSTPRHEVFVDLSVLGIEEDEDADAEFVAREGESPPGEVGPKRRRRNSNARDAIRELVKAPHAPAIPVEPKLAQSFQTLAWKQPGPQAPRLSTPPLRPKIFVEPVPAPKALQTPEPKEQAKPVAPAQELGTSRLSAPPTPKEEPAAAKQLSSLAAAWSAKRLKKVDPGTPLTAPADSGMAKPAVESPVETPVETPVSKDVAEPVSNEAPEISATVAATTTLLSETAKLQSAPEPTPAPANPAAPVDPPISAEIQTPPQPEPAAWLESEPVPVSAPTVEAKITELPKVEPPLSAPAKLPARPKVDMSAPPLTPSRPERANQKTLPNKHVAPSPVPGESRTVQKAAERAKALEAQKNEAQKSGPPKKADAPAATNAAKLPTPEPLPQKPPFDAPLLGSGGTQSGSFWANLPVLPKIALALGLTAAIGGGAWFTLHPTGSSTSSSNAQQAKKPHGPARPGRSLMMNLPGGWSPDFGGDFNRKKNRTISLYRPSVSNHDYRMEFEGQVDSRALGWVVRATDAKNYYGYKIELIRTGADPGAALARFAVVNGDESQKHFTPLLKPIRPGASFRVRLDVLGDEFSTYINDELVEVWQEDRLPKGGFGVMTELGEVGQIRKLQVFELQP